MRARILLVIMLISSLGFLSDIAFSQGRGGDFRFDSDGSAPEDSWGPWGQQRGPRNGEFREDGNRPGQGPGGMGQMMGMGPDSGMMGPRMGRGMFGPSLTTEELLAFLKEHDPVKASQFEEMFQKQPEQFKEYISFICELYTPASKLMEYDKEAGTLAVKNISLSLDIKKQVAEYKESENERVKKRIKSELTDSLEKQFDVILESQQREIDFWKDRLSRFSAGTDEGSDSSSPKQQPNMFGQGGPGRNGPGGGPGGRGRMGRSEEMQQRVKEQFEKRQQDIEKWKKQKKQIVERKLIDLVEDVRPFPWTN